MKRWISISLNAAPIAAAGISMIPGVRWWHVFIPITIVLAAMLCAFIREAIREIRPCHFGWHKWQERKGIESWPMESCFITTDPAGNKRWHRVETGTGFVLGQKCSHCGKTR